MSESEKTVKQTKKTTKGSTQVTDKKVKVTPALEDTRSAEAVAKAGKRSSKALTQAKELQAKEERKKTEAKNKKESTLTKSTAVTRRRSRFEQRGKKYRKLAEQVDKEKFYSLEDAFDLATKTSPVKFDATVELHIRLNVDPKQANQNIRDTVILPAGTGKEIRVAVFAEPEVAKDAKKAGANIALSDEFLQQLEKSALNFDVLIATPGMMPKLGKFARLLGPKGLMPNPKSGTVTTDVVKAVNEAKMGRVEYRVDSSGIIHSSIGKVSFGKEKLLQNALAVLGSVKSNKPAAVKANYIRSLFVSTTMGPSVRANFEDA